MQRREFLLGTTTLMVVPFLSFADGQSTIQRLVDLTKQVLITLQNDGYAYENITHLVDEIFDRKRIAQVIAGRKSWFSATEEERKAFTEAVTHYLFSSYVGSLESYGVDKALNLMDTLKWRETERGKWVFYKTVLFLQTEVGLNVRTIEGKVADIEAENISLVLTIKDELTFLTRKGLKHATEKLIEKVK